MARFDKSIALANRLITKNGSSVILRRFDDAVAPDPTTPWRVGAATTTDYVATIVFLPLGSENNVDGTENYVFGENTHKSQTRAYMAPNVAVRPRLTDRIIDGSQAWEIDDIRVLEPNGQEVLYELIVRN